MLVRRRSYLWIPLAALVLLSQGCDEDATAPELSTLAARLAVTGNAPDPDGVAVRLDGGAWRTLFAGEVVSLGAVEAGSHVVELGDVADHCQVAGENPRVVGVAAGSAATVTFDVACSTPAEDGSATFEWLRAVGPYPEGEARTDTTTGETALEERVDGLWSCTVERVSSEQYPDDYATFNPNAEVIYPGSMLQGATLADATPEPVLVERAGGTLVINLVNGSAGVYRHVDKVRQSTVIQAINDILAENSGIGTARFTFSSSAVQSHEELAASLGVNVSTFSTDFRSALAFSRDRDYNRFMVRLDQSFYTVSFDLPLSLSDLFAPSVTIADLERYVGPGNPPTYISSVTYGRTYYLLIESTASVAAMRSSIQASYNAAVVDGSLEAGATYVKDLADVTIKVFALGGDQSLAAASFNGDLDALATFLTDGADIRTGTPLSYVVRNVADNRIVNVKVATDYDIRSCVPVITETLASGFDESVEGWTAYGNGTAATLQFLPTSDDCLQGGDGGCIRMTDESSAGMQFRAPLSWREGRSWLPFYGGWIRYRIRNTGGTPSPSTIRGVIIEGSAGQISAELPEQVITRAHELGWEGVEYALDENGTTFASADGRVVKWLRTDGQEATREEIEAVLQRVTDFRIVGDLYYGGDTTYLDAVEVVAADSSTGIGM